MGSRGPRSAAENSTLRAIAVRRPPPPAELTEAEAAIWRDIVASSPADWFRREAFPILVELCRHAARAAVVDGLLRQFELEWVKTEGGLDRLDKLLSMAERESRAILACSRSLRLTPQSQIRASVAGTARKHGPESPRPWD